ncbi:MAG TPA: hypothetical protein VGE25_15490 [Sediminibacterium sp.]
MKQFLSIILLVLLGLQSSYPLAVYSYYYANKGFIASVLCENRDKPRLHCNGKCYLQKQLKKAEQQENKDRTVVKTTEPLVYLVHTPLQNHPQMPAVVAQVYPVYHTDGYSFLFATSCFRPPGV